MIDLTKADVDALKALREFLGGAGAMDGCWFGDKHPDHKGAFWWRANLSLIDKALAELDRVKADAAAAVALVVERCAYEVRGSNLGLDINDIADDVLALAPVDGLAMVQELRAENEGAHMIIASERAEVRALRKERDRYKVACDAQGKTVVDVAGVMDGISPAQIEAMSAILLNPMSQAAEAERDTLAAESARLSGLVEKLTGAVDGLLRSACGSTGFAEAVRHNSGMAYPWPSLEIAEAKARAALASAQPGGEG